MTDVGSEFLRRLRQGARRQSRADLLNIVREEPVQVVRAGKWEAVRMDGSRGASP